MSFQWLLCFFWLSVEKKQRRDSSQHTVYKSNKPFVNDEGKSVFKTDAWYVLADSSVFFSDSKKQQEKQENKKKPGFKVYDRP